MISWALCSMTKEHIDIFKPQLVKVFPTDLLENMRIELLASIADRFIHDLAKTDETKALLSDSIYIEALFTQSREMADRDSLADHFAKALFELAEADEAIDFTQIARLFVATCNIEGYHIDNIPALLTCKMNELTDNSQGTKIVIGIIEGLQDFWSAVPPSKRDSVKQETVDTLVDWELLGLDLFVITVVGAKLRLAHPCPNLKSRYFSLECQFATEKFSIIF